MRKIIYISGTRADFGLMQSTLRLIDRDQDLELGIIVTGMHLSPKFGETVREVEASGLTVSHRIPTDLEPATGATMARAIGTMTSAFVDAFLSQKPDIVLLLGDRGEMLAAAIAAVHLNIPVAHIHGGERSGTIDESVRHAISKLSHIHLVATGDSRERLIKMGEKPENIHQTGAPGLDGVMDQAIKPYAELCGELGLSERRPVCLFLFHPVLQEAGDAGRQAKTILTSVLDAGWQVAALMPNSDAGSAEIREAVAEIDTKLLHPLTHIGRPDFLSLLKSVDLLIGNSSAGIIEAASFGTPVLNFGSRQALRERNKNVVDVAIEPGEIEKALEIVQSKGRFPPENIYGDGKAGQRICAALKSVDLNADLMNKVMEY